MGEAAKRLLTRVWWWSELRSLGTMHSLRLRCQHAMARAEVETGRFLEVPGLSLASRRGISQVLRTCRASGLATEPFPQPLTCLSDASGTFFSALVSYFSCWVQNSGHCHSPLLILHGSAWSLVLLLFWFRLL